MKSFVLNITDPEKSLSLSLSVFYNLSRPLSPCVYSLGGPSSVFLYTYIIITGGSGLITHMKTIRLQTPLWSSTDVLQTCYRRSWGSVTSHQRLPFAVCDR